MSRLTQNGTAEPVSRDQFSGATWDGKNMFHVQLTTNEQKKGNFTRLAHTLLFSEVVILLVLIGLRYFQHAHFIPIVGVGKRGAY